MSRSHLFAVTVATAVLGLTACNDTTAPDSFFLDSAFGTASAGYNEVSSSFASTDSSGSPWRPERGRGGPRMFGGPGGPGMRGIMGGGLDGNFLGAVGFGRGPDRGPFASRDTTGCTFSSATGDITCGPYTRSGLTVTRVLTYKNAAGTAQSALDSTTSTARTRITANGTVTRRDSVTATVQNSSDRTVTGLQVGSTLRTVNGTSRGSESASGTTRDGKAFTSQRTVGDTTTGLTIPVENGRPTYPTAGSVVRSMRVVMTVDGEARTSTRREVITYNGTATASLVITHDGNVKTCTLPLPMGRPVCQ